MIADDLATILTGVDFVEEVCRGSLASAHSSALMPWTQKTGYLAGADNGVWPIIVSTTNGGQNWTKVRRSVLVVGCVRSSRQRACPCL